MQSSENLPYTMHFAFSFSASCLCSSSISSFFKRFPSFFKTLVRKLSDSGSSEVCDGVPPPVIVYPVQGLIPFSGIGDGIEGYSDVKISCLLI